MLCTLVYSITDEGNYRIDIDIAYKPCGDFCCHMQYFIQLDPLTMEVDAVYHNMEGVHNWPDCDNPDCTKNCDVLEFDWTKDDGFQKVCIEYNKKININEDVSIMPNPNDGEFIIKVHCVEKGNTVINLFSLRGECIYTFRFDKTTYLFIKRIKTNIINNSIIYYNVLINDTLIKNGMFLISK